MSEAGQLHEPDWLTPQPTPTGQSPQLPERASYRLKRILLGPPLVSDQLHSERLGKPTALAVLSSDVMSSCAYATESILRILIPAAGVAAFMLITPVTLMLLVVLGVVCLCYRQVVKAYPVSGGSYVVSRENFGYTTAQIPGAALLCSYTLTVAVSIAAGVDAIVSAFGSLAPYRIPLACGFVVLLTFGNLRGIREAGRFFALPTYWFLASMAATLIAGAARLASGSLGHVPVQAHHIHFGTSGSGLLLGVGAFLFLRAFANGGSAMTGMEAISNAVPVFREPNVRNAQLTLVTMATVLGVMFFGVSGLAALTHAVPYVSGAPTVLSQIGRLVFGTGTLGAIPYYSLQFSTALILILGANTSFNGFPLLVSFIAQDAYLPRPLITRGHRLVFSNGILMLTVVSLALLVVSNANVASLIPLYACTVFTGFTMAGAGMTKYHLRNHLPHRTRNLIINGAALATSGTVTLIFLVTEFTRGAWLVAVVVPLIVFVLSRTHRRYEAEKAVLAEDAATAASEAPTLRNHLVVVLVDQLDLATARALQLARSLAGTDDIKAVHFMADPARAARLRQAWSRLGLQRISLEIIECRDRRLVRAATELAAALSSDGETEVLLVLPRRAYRGVASRILHDHTADRIVAAVSQLPHVSATVAPFDVAGLLRQRSRALATQRERSAGLTVRRQKAADGNALSAPEHLNVAVRGDITPLGEVRHRQRTRVAGRVRAVRVQTWAGTSAFECTLVDATGALTVVFLGRRAVPGISPGTEMVAEGMVGSHQGQLAMLNPSYEILAVGPALDAVEQVAGVQNGGPAEGSAP